jgi:hypothetical protein
MIRFHLKWMLPTSNLLFQPVSNHFTPFRPISVHFTQNIPFCSISPSKRDYIIWGRSKRILLICTVSLILPCHPFHYLSHPPWGYWGLYSKSIEQLKIEFPFLDWDYMQDPTKGEFVCDVGITFHPNSDEPLVGLWKLDLLEASFGAGGYLQGNLHWLNTLSLYGGLQAEQAIDRKTRSHVTFRSAHNIAYEVARKMNNQRDLFQEKDLYHLTDKYFQDRDAVISLYQGASSNLSYGV